MPWWCATAITGSVVPSFPGRFEGPSIRSYEYIDPTEPLALAGARVLVAPDEALAERGQQLAGACCARQQFLAVARTALPRRPY